MNTPKGRHRQASQVTVRLAAIYVLLGVLVGALITLSGLGYYVAFGGSLR